MSGESNGAWGELVEHDTALGEVWDGYARLPDEGENPALDALCERKRITIASLVRQGARLSDYQVLAFAYGAGLKYRDVVTGRRWAYVDSEFTRLKIVRAGPDPSDTVIVVEGETDGARVGLLYPDVDVAIMPAGALHFPQEYANQVTPYARVLIGLDADDAGDQGAAKVAELVPHAVRFRPPANDWCETDEPPPLPDVVAPLPVLVPAGALLELDVPEVASWFEHELLPIGGLAILHGWAKSFKTFQGLDILAALAQGQPWCCFEPTEEPCRVAVIQFELAWAYYRRRVARLLAHAAEPDLLRANFLTFSPLARPRIHAGNTAEEDLVLRELDNAGVQVVLIDPIRRAMGTLDMNAENEVRKMLGFFERLNNIGITVIATHHDNKEGAKAGGGSPVAMTGSGAWAGDPDTVISVELPKGERLDTSTRRNLRFTLRNAAPIGPRSFEMRADDERSVYSLEAWGPDAEPDDAPPADDLPPI